LGKKLCLIRHSRRLRSIFWRNNCGSSGTRARQRKIDQTLYDSTDTATNRKRLAGPLKGALLRVVDALLDEVLRDLSCSFLRAFNATLSTSTSNAVYNPADCVAAEYFNKANRDKFRSTHNGTEQGSLLALFKGGALGACALACFTCT
jgi:hypothetical protein